MDILIHLPVDLYIIVAVRRQEKKGECRPSAAALGLHSPFFAFLGWGGLARYKILLTEISMPVH
jgi:hypothetical protein